MICGSGKAAEVKLFGKHQFCGKRLVVLATSRKGETLVLNVDRRGKYGPGLQVINSKYVNCGKYETEQQDPEDVQVPAAHGRWQGEGGRLLVSIF